MWNAIIEQWTTDTLVYVPALPGLYGKAESVDDALAILHRTLDPFLDWLHADELTETRLPSGPITVIEARNAAGEAGPLFTIDSERPDADWLELALAVGRAALSDMIYTYDELETPSKSAADRMLRHVAELDRWYATRLRGGTGHPSQSLEDEIVQSASFFEDVVDLVFADGSADISREVDGEEWTLAKILRRRTVHLREHLADLIALDQGE